MSGHAKWSDIKRARQEIVTVICLLRVDDQGRALNPKCARGFTMPKRDWEFSSQKCSHCKATLRVVDRYVEFNINR